MSASLYCKNERSDKVYHINIEKAPGPGYLVNFSFGRRGSSLQHGTKTDFPVSIDRASVILEELVREKLAKGYQELGPSTKPTSGKVMVAELTTPYPPELLEPLSVAAAKNFIVHDAYVMQTKYNGKRIQVHRFGRKVTCYNKLGNQIPTPSTLESTLLEFEEKEFFMDGELVNGVFIAFDLLSYRGASIAAKPYSERYVALMGFPNSKYFQISDIAVTRQQKLKKLQELWDSRAEGFVLKLSHAGYKAGRNGQQKKVKFWKTLSAIITTVRANGKDSVKLGLIENGQMVDVGKCTSLGKTLPVVGGIVEVKYLYATKDKQLYQSEIIGVRDDVSREECTTKQLVFQQGI